MGVGGKLYRQGLIKMSEFVTLCSRDKVPMIWFQDTSGIDVGDTAEKAELLGLGQSLIYSIENSKLPMMLVVLRKGTAAAHYVLGGPTANNNNAFSLGTATTEINVMHGETAAAASYARRLVKEKDAGKPLGPIIDKMNGFPSDSGGIGRKRAAFGPVEAGVFSGDRSHCLSRRGRIRPRRVHKKQIMSSGRIPDHLRKIWINLS